MKGTEVKNQQTLNDIKTRELLSMLRKIALPIALQSLIGSSLSLIDNLMVGSLGELQLNAVGVSVQIFLFTGCCCTASLAVQLRLSPSSMVWGTLKISEEQQALP